MTVLTLIVAAAILSAGLIRLIRPWLTAYALARPNARSSHKVPTPQGAGIGIIAATLLVAGAALAIIPAISLPALALLFAATIGITVLGVADDLKSVPVLPRLLGQGAAVGLALWIVPADFHVSPWLPLGVERLALLFAGLWFVNLVNFMDGLDWLTVAETVPVTLALVVLGMLGNLPAAQLVIAAALLGGMLGFAPFNRPVAKLFLGDGGSLPIGLLLGWCLLGLAQHGHYAAALLLPLYYLMDATLTLLRRLFGGEAIWTAHRSHFYQRATSNGFSVIAVVGHVFALNIALAALAFASVWVGSGAFGIAMVAAGAALVGLVLRRFSSPR